MFCSKCGAQIGDDDKFCKACGTPVNVQPAAPVTQQAPVQQVAAVQPPVEKNSISDEEQARRKKKGTILGIISMVILFVSSAIFIPLGISRVLDDYPLFAVATAFVYIAAVVSAYVLMIVSLVKYRSALSKIMIWIYGAILIISGIVCVVLLIGFGMDCANECTECVHHF